MEERQSRLSNMDWKRFRPYLCVRLIPQNSMFSNFCHVLKSQIYSSNEYKKTDRRKALADHEYFENNQEAILKAQNGGQAKITYTDSAGNEIASPVYEAQKHSLEPDYKMK